MSYEVNTYYYKNGGFYLNQDSENSRYEISKEYWEYLLKEQSNGKKITQDADGKPICVERDIDRKVLILSEIKNIKIVLESTDYKIIKCYEAFMRQLPLPYNLEELSAQRDAWRAEINQLEEELKAL